MYHYGYLCLSIFSSLFPSLTFLATIYKYTILCLYICVCTVYSCTLVCINMLQYTVECMQIETTRKKWSVSFLIAYVEYSKRCLLNYTYATERERDSKKDTTHKHNTISTTLYHMPHIYVHYAIYYASHTLFVCICTCILCIIILSRIRLLYAHVYYSTIHTVIMYTICVLY